MCDPPSLTGSKVGEHILHKLEMMMIRNLHAHNRKGIILSWGQLSQNGWGHVNNHSPSYIEGILKSLGYYRDVKLETKMRDRAGYPASEGEWMQMTPPESRPKPAWKWLRGNIFVFVRIKTALHGHGLASNNHGRQSGHLGPKRTALG